jgi:hypothetical protein
VKQNRDSAGLDAQTIAEVEQYGGKTKQQCEEAERRIKAILARLGLELHPDKTRRVELYDGKQGFDFLGCHLRKRMSGSIWERERKRVYFLHRQPSKRAMKRIRQRVRETTPRGRCHADLRAVIAELNPILRGWGAYFGTGNAARSFNQIDTYVHERLRGLRVKRAGRQLDGRIASTATPRALPQAVCGKSARTVSTGVVWKPVDKTGESRSTNGRASHRRTP